MWKPSRALRDAERVNYAEIAPGTAAVDRHRTFQFTEARLWDWTGQLPCRATRNRVPRTRSTQPSRGSSSPRTRPGRPSRDRQRPGRRGGAEWPPGGQHHDHPQQLSRCRLVHPRYQALSAEVAAGEVRRCGRGAPRRICIRRAESCLGCCCDSFRSVDGSVDHVRCAGDRTDGGDTEVSGDDRRSGIGDFGATEHCERCGLPQFQGTPTPTAPQRSRPRRSFQWRSRPTTGRQGDKPPAPRTTRTSMQWVVHRLHEPISVTERLDLIDAAVAWSGTRGRSSRNLPDEEALEPPADPSTTSSQRECDGTARADRIVEPLFILSEPVPR